MLLYVSVFSGMMCCIGKSGTTEYNPVFSQTTYEFEVNDGTTSGSKVGFVTILDACGSDLIFDINSGSTDNAFEITNEEYGQSGGMISVAKTMNNAENPYYKMVVTAFDGTYTGRTTVIVTVRCNKYLSSGGATLMPMLSMMMFMVLVIFD